MQGAVAPIQAQAAQDHGTNRASRTQILRYRKRAEYSCRTTYMRQVTGRVSNLVHHGLLDVAHLFRAEAVMR